jgi:hypothetical protein
MLTETQKRIISTVLEDYSELKSIELSFEKRKAEIVVSVMPDENPNKVCEPAELNDLMWRPGLDSQYVFHLSGLQKIAISSHREILPKEIQATEMPSREFVLFATSIFEQQAIYEWNCFGDPSRCFKGDWKAAWTYEFRPESQTSGDCILFFKERQKSSWVIGLWFSALAIEGYLNDEQNLDAPFITVEDLAAKYPKRLGGKYKSA